ncbi:hypothetical protein BD779DRAFT_1668027 [Infundibulicybe gibba]|nr:hypothetical protein BD779DRAFT_1668027 [Infundibulicybe gibba]
MAPRIAIIGAGAGGLMSAIALKRKLGFENFIIYEKTADVGGTWNVNRYPGCSSDVGVHFYSFSTDLKTDWSSSHAFQPEVQTYWRQLAEKNALLPKIQFNCLVLSAEWDGTRQLYEIITEDTITKAEGAQRQRSSFLQLVYLRSRNFLTFLGYQRLKATSFTRKMGRYRFADKPNTNHITSTQMVPIVCEVPGVQVTQFCRTPNWLLPPVRVYFSSLKRWAFKYIPFYMRAYRNALYLRTEFMYFMVFGNSWFNKVAEKKVRKYILDNAPSKYHDKLIPKYTLGCKRVIFDTDYLASLHKPNMTLNWDGIKSITEGGILTKTGTEIPFDVIITTTGFAAHDFPFPVRGRHSTTIMDYYNSQNGPKAYLGTCIPGFPNYFLLSGPNTATGHTSVIFTEELQIDYIIQLIKPILKGQSSSFEVTHEATDAYNEKIHARLARSVFTQCASWYRVGGVGKVASIFPGPGMLYWWWLRRPNWQHYIATNRDGSVSKTRSRPSAAQSMATGAVITATIVGLGAWYTSGWEFEASSFRAHLTYHLPALLEFKCV